MARKRCIFCGNVISEDIDNCPECGCPNVSKRTKKKNRTGLLTAGIIFLAFICVAIVVASICFVLYKSKEASVKKENAYYNDVKEISTSMMDGAKKAEDLAILVQKVWRNAIWEKSDKETDKYTMVDGQFVADFNEALSNLYLDPEVENNIQQIRENQFNVLLLMKKLRNPPGKYETVYEDVKAFYDCYFKLTNMAINPSGSFNTFSEDFRKIDGETVDAIMKLGLDLD